MALSLILRNAISIRLSAVNALNVPKRLPVNRLIGHQILVCQRSVKSVRCASTQDTEPTNSVPKRRQEGKGGPFTWKTLILSSAAIGLMLQVLSMAKEKRRKELEREQMKSMGQAAIGGEFELVDHNNKLTHSKEFFGKWILLYFGFTHCPDICPEELEKMAKVVDMLDKKVGQESLQPLFISVDPERDSPSSIAKYVADFSPRLLGLTGSIDQIKDVCHKFRIYFSMGPKEDNDYIVDHSIIMYLLNPKGEFVDYYSQSKTCDDVFNSVHMHMLMYDSMAKKK